MRLVVDYINLYEEIIEHDGEDGKMYVDPDCGKVYANEKRVLKHEPSRTPKKTWVVHSIGSWNIFIA